MIAQQRAAGYILLLLVVIFVFQAFAFQTGLRPDEARALGVFQRAIFGSAGFTTEVATRVTLAIFNYLCVLLLTALRLIDTRTLILALIWPLTVFLFSKVYWEFWIFPLCLLRLDRSVGSDVRVIIAFVGLGFTTGEANMAVLCLFRCIILAQKVGYRAIAPLTFLALSLAIDVMMDTGAAKSLPIIGPHLARFDFTRNIVNPEYSILETAQVFTASFHMFTLHTGPGVIVDAAFSVAVLAVIFNSRAATRSAKENWPLLLALGCTILGFTSITHAFQNARYYFFFMPVLAGIVSSRSYIPLATLGALHVIALASVS